MHFLIEGVICESRPVDVSIFEGFSRGKESNLWITFCGEQRSRIGVCVDRMCVVFMLDFFFGGEISAFGWRGGVNSPLLAGWLLLLLVTRNTMLG